MEERQLSTVYSEELAMLDLMFVWPNLENLLGGKESHCEDVDTFLIFF